MAHVHVEGWLLLVSGGEGDRVLLEAVWYQIYKENKNKNIKKPKIDGQLSKEKVMSETLALSTEDTLSPLSQNMPSSSSS